jgi:cation diffusion facilitator CzcD-associated flavoprotein CzcO
MQHEVVHAEWSDDTKKWTVQVKRPDGTLLVDEADVFINAGGELPLLDRLCSQLGAASIRFS